MVGSKVVGASWMMMLLLLLPACTWFSRPAPPRATPDPAAEKRAAIRAALARPHTPRQGCLLQLHAAVLDFMDGARPGLLRTRLDAACPAGWSAVFGAAQARLDGDPWASQDEALRFLEATGTVDDDGVAQLRSLAGVLLSAADPPDTAFLRRLAATAKRDPSLPAFLWVQEPRLLRELAPPEHTEALGTGLSFSHGTPEPLIGRLHFSRPSPIDAGSLWKDGDLLSSRSGHPERVSLTLPLSCATPGPMLLELRPEGPAAVRIDGVFEAESARTPGVETGVWRLQLPAFTGPRTLVISLVASARAGHPRIRLVPSTACTFGVQPDAAADGSRTLPAWLTPFARLVEAQTKAAAGSYMEPRTTLSALISRTPHFSYARAVLTRALLTDPTLLPETARRLALQQTAASPQDGWSLLEQAWLDEADGRPDLALEKFSRLSSPWAVVTRTRLALEAGQDVPAQLAALLTSFSHHRVFLAAAAAVLRSDPRLALARLKPALALRPDLPDLLRFHLQTQQFAEALVEGQRLDAAGFGSEDVHSQLYSACLGLRRPDCALQWADRRLAADPASESAFLRRLDVRTALGHDPAELFRELASHVRRHPVHRDALLLYWSSPSLRPEKLPDLKTLLDMNWGAGAPAVFLLNREEQFLSPEGGGFVRVTRWVRLNTPVAVEELGELELPDDAIVLDVSTLKGDGSVYPPSSTPQKSSFSLRNLEPGDIVSFSYLRVISPVAGLPGRTWGHRFHFAHRAFPTVLAEWIVHAPADLPLVLRPEGSLPELRRTQDADGVHLRLSAWTRERLPTELRMARFVSPSIQVHAGFSERDLYALFAEETPWPDWDSLELAAQARQLCPRPGAACVPDTARWVLRRIREDRSITRPSHILQRQVGSRIHLLFALLRHQGHAPRMLLARASRKVDGPVAWPDPEDFPIWLLEVPGFGVIDTRFVHLPPGQMVPATGGTQAVVLSPTPATVRLKAAAPQSRRLEVRVKVFPDRSARFEIREVSRGFHAVQKLDQFVSLSPEALREQIQVESLQRYFPGSVLLSLDWKRPPPDQDELVAGYSFTAPAVCSIAEGSNLELRRFPFPWNLRRRFGVFLPRTTDFLPNALPDTRLEMTIDPPAGLRVEPAPELKLETEFGRLHRRLLPGPGRSARLILEKSIRQEVVPVANWKTFSAFVQLFDEYETLPVVLAPAN